MEEEKDNKLVIFGAIATIVIIGLWITTYFLLKDQKERGSLGDMFGTVNALFSGLALAGIIFTILLQRKELSYQREELKATRLEFNIQNETLRLQRFENTFFNLLSVHHKIVDSIDFDSKVDTTGGYNAVRGLHREYQIVTVKSRDVFKQKYEALVSSLDTENNDKLNRSYLKFYGTVQTDFGHYFRNLYRIIKFIDETEFVSKESLEISNGSQKAVDLIKYKISNHNIRYKYTSMVRAQLSDYELLWLFYNCLSENGNEKFKPLIEEYSLLKNIPMNEIQSYSLLKKYNKKSYGKSFEFKD